MQNSASAQPRTDPPKFGSPTPGQSTLTGSDFAPSTIRKAELSDCTDDSPELSPAPPSDDGTGAQTREPPTNVEDATTYPRPPDRPPLRVE